MSILPRRDGIAWSVAGEETQATRSLSEVVLYTLRTTLWAVIGKDTAEQLLIQLRAAWLMTKQLPSCIRPLCTGKRLSSLECGVPPPNLAAYTLPLESKHVA